MITANFLQENKLRQQGIKWIVGVDEVGRGPLAGPVVAGAVAFDFAHSDFKNFIANLEFRDSKLYTKKKRQEVYDLLQSFEGVFWHVASVSAGQIDRINILEASKLAMKKAVEGLKINPQFLLIDGKYTLENYPCNQKAFIKGDQKIASVAAASVLAKVRRDKYMEKCHQKWPQYGFDQHKGYGTRQHKEAIAKFGPCPIHRMSFAPLK